MLAAVGGKLGGCEYVIMFNYVLYVFSFVIRVAIYFSAFVNEPNKNTNISIGFEIAVPVKGRKIP